MPDNFSMWVNAYLPGAKITQKLQNESDSLQSSKAQLRKKIAQTSKGQPTQPGKATTL
jgi:hypothetical protein